MRTLPSLPSVKVAKRWNGKGAKQTTSESYGDESTADDAEHEQRQAAKKSIFGRNTRNSRLNLGEVHKLDSSRYSRDHQQKGSSLSSSSPRPSLTSSSSRIEKESGLEGVSSNGGTKQNKYMPTMKMPKLPSRTSFRKEDGTKSKVSSDDNKASDRFASASSKRAIARARMPFKRSESYSYSLNLSSTDELHGSEQSDVRRTEQESRKGSFGPTLARSRTSPALPTRPPLPARPSQAGRSEESQKTMTSKSKRNNADPEQGTRLTIDRSCLESAHVKETSNDSRLMADDNTFVTNHSPARGVPDITWQKPYQGTIASKAEQQPQLDLPASYPTSWEEFGVDDDRRGSLGFVGMHLTGNTASSSSEGGNPFIGSGDELSPVNTGNYRSFSPARSERIGSIGEAWPGSHAEEQDYEPGDGLLHVRPNNTPAAAGRVARR